VKFTTDPSCSGLAKRTANPTFRHSFATHLVEDGCDIRTVQEILGHRDVLTSMVHTHVQNRGGRGVHSLLDVLRKAVSSQRDRSIRANRSAQNREGSCWI
jgi:hypothetical protein